MRSRGKGTLLAVVGEGDAALAKRASQLVKARLEFALAVTSDLVHDTAVDRSEVLLWAGRYFVPGEFGIDVQVRLYPYLKVPFSSVSQCFYGSDHDELV